jgi:hypothetical protein
VARTPFPRELQLLKGVAFGAVALAFAAQTVGAQTSDSTTAALRELISFLDENGKVALIKGATISKYNTTARMSGACRVVFDQTIEVGTTYRVVTETEVPLGALAPTAEVRKWDGEEAYTVTAITSNGADELSARTTSGMGPNRMTYSVVMTLEDSSAAANAARRLNLAIRKCGGKPATAEALARHRSNAVRSTAMTDSLLGRTLSANERALIVRTCRDAIREKLRAPTQAVFDGGAPEPNVFAVTGGEPTLMGKVEAQNAMGGRVEETYWCKMEKFGNRYVPKTAVIMK